ncbi:hypothetical protein PHLGIDRAFT_77016 [Phlebiopsis gigantea 11061_1 CR5-6]|uniref:Cytochrome P450 n=1 Tax=Phlebiopsis gigantea (strain 11061_1 CR5-6) TaxID=745531 RepID=A0A0C3NGB1_PHLG1|nr:hypothetical protein PHLGIDRAFT_77016 [Phlebiopsis gigantea 11061_1 CR5-6]
MNPTPESAQRYLAASIASPLAARPLLFLFSLYLAYAASLVFYRLFLSPLASLPGPWYAAVSDFWITTHVVRMQQCRTVQSLFDAYGPIVRIGPAKIAFCDLGTMRSVYCVHKFDKSPYYKSLLTNNNDHAMTTLPHAQHAARKKSYAPHYTPANLALFQPELHDLALKLSNVLGHTSASVDCLDLFRHLMVDVVACTVFGSRSGSLDNWASGVRDPLGVAVYDFPKRGILRSAVPTWAWNLVCRIPNARVREICNSDKIMAEFVGSRLYEMRASVQAAKLGYAPAMPLIQRLLEHKMASAPGAKDQVGAERDIISEAMGHLVAGVDTSSTTLSYMFWELSRRRDIAQRLQAEIDEVMPDRGVVPDAAVLGRCVYLDAFVKEALRLYGAAPSLLERVVPSPTAKAHEDFDMMGYALPPGTVVSTQAWSMHRAEDVFPSAETFLPERWLVDASACAEEDEARLARMHAHLVPFGVGTRVCGGQNLAQLMMRIVLVAVLRAHDVRADVRETNERSMEMRDAFVLFPKAKECRLAFVPRAAAA